MMSDCKRISFTNPFLLLLLFAFPSFALVPVEGTRVLAAPSAAPDPAPQAQEKAAVQPPSRSDPSQAQIAQGEGTAPQNTMGQSKGVEAEMPAGGTDGFLLARTLGGLGLVVSTILVGYFAVRKFGPKYLRQRSDPKALTIIETLPLGEKRNIALIQVCDQRLLIGHTAGQITLLAQIPVPPDPAPASGQKIEAKAPSAVASFRRLYEVEKSKTVQPPSKPIPPDLREKMRQLREALEK